MSVFLCAACGTDGDIGDIAVQSTWTTEEDVKFGDFPERNLVFSGPLVSADPVRNRVLVMDPANSQVSAWSEGGELLFVVGREGEGPGEFTVPQGLLVEEDGFVVASSFGSYFTYFDSDGGLIRSELGPGTQLGYQGHRVQLGWPKDGVYVGVPMLSAGMVTGKVGVRAIDRYPLLGVRRSGAGGWRDPEPLLTLDQRNRFAVRASSSGGWAYSGQFFSDADQVRFLPGRALVTRQKGAPGIVELIEIDGRGDTLWHRHLRFEPRRLTRRMSDAGLDVMVKSLAA
ncbi:MAG: 6-bladed beta-propeller, partial [Gemmatimonadota bacterium]|nr:6-bladed beta-propeller [Gemmatimonadota bacterium]